MNKAERFQQANNKEINRKHKIKPKNKQNSANLFKVQADRKNNDKIINQ